MAFEDGTVEYQDGVGLGIPPKEGDITWKISVFRHIEYFTRTLQNLNGPTDLRPYLLARMIVLHHPDRAEELLKELDTEMEKVPQRMDLDNEEKGLLRILIAQNALGPVITAIGETDPFVKEIVVAPLARRTP